MEVAYKFWYYTHALRNAKFYKFKKILLNKYSLSVGNGNANLESSYKHFVPRTHDEMLEALNKQSVNPVDSQILKIAILGIPNSGKSTLVNSLCEWKICSVSKRPHTTRIPARAVFNSQNKQLIFIDTPGIVTPKESKKFSLEKSLVTGAEISLHNADLIAVLHDVTAPYRNSLHPWVLRILALYPLVPCILILNKIDQIKEKRKLLDISRSLTDGVVGNKASHSTTKKPLSKDKILKKLLKDPPPPIENLNLKVQNTMQDYWDGKISLTEHQAIEFVKERSGWPKFTNLFMVSALDGSGVDDLREFFLASAYSSPWIFPNETVTDQDPYEIAKQIVREKYLDIFKQEIPYLLKFEIELWEITQSDVLEIVIGVICPNSRIVTLLIGPKGAKVQQISRFAEMDLCGIFNCDVHIRLNVYAQDKNL